MKSFGLTDKGTVRADNQDSFILERCRNSLIFALCDGMGGARAGGLASQLSNKAFVAYIYARLTSRVNLRQDFRSILLAACSEANGVAFEYSHFSDEFSGMGSTIVGGVIRANGTGELINVGDSRAYLIERQATAIRQITRDHSLVEELVEFGAITREEALTHPQRNVITRALGSEPTVEADCYELELQSGDILLLCSDGLSNVVRDEEMLRCAAGRRDPEQLCRALMHTALERGARDNVTVLAILR